MGKKEDAEYYGQLRRTVGDAFRREYITATGRLVSETQTACVLVLHFGLAGEEHRGRIMEALVKNIAAHKEHLSTGFMGTPYLCHVLSENGQHELAGINQLEPGFRRIQIKPMPVKGITRAKASLKSAYGMRECAWICENGKFTVDLHISVNTRAEVYLPEKDEMLELGSGSYHYVYDTTLDLTTDRFSTESTLGQILQEPAAVEMLEGLAPGMLDNPMIGFAKNMSIGELSGQMPPEGKALFEAVIAMLNENEG